MARQSIHGIANEGAPLLGAYPYLVSADLDEARQFISRQFRDHKLDNLVRVTPVRVVQNSVPLEGASFHYLDYGAAVRVRADALSHFYLVILPVFGKAELRCRGEAVVATPQTAAIIPCDATFEILWGADCKAVIARVDRQSIDLSLDRRLGMTLKRPVQFALSVPTLSGPGRYLRDFVLSSVNQFDQDPSIATNTILRNEIGGMVARCMLGAIPHNYSHLAEKSAPRAASRCVQNVIDYVDRHAHDPLTLETLVDVAGVSGRALQTAFQRHGGMSPIEYVRHVRLHRARTDLLAADPNAGVTVTSVALKWGFGHFGRFSSYYQDLFGELPSDTLRR